MAKINPAPDFKAMGLEILKKLPRGVSRHALAHFKMSFRKQGFTDYSFIAWPKRKDDLSHLLLRNLNSLLNDLKVTHETMDRIEICTTLPYADIHNTGGRFSVRVTDKMRKFFWAKFDETEEEKWKFMALTKKKRLAIRIPQRQYIGNSATLNSNIDKMIIQLIITEFNKK